MSDEIKTDEQAADYPQDVPPGAAEGDLDNTIQMLQQLKRDASRMLKGNSSSVARLYFEMLQEELSEALKTAQQIRGRFGAVG